MSKVLTINPGSTSTKLGIFDNDTMTHMEELMHPKDELAACRNINEQLPLRLAAVRNFLESNKISLNSLDAVTGRGGLLRSVKGGVYAVNDAMLADLGARTYGEHASNLGAPIAYELAKEAGIPAFVVDPVVTDEMMDLARITGLPEVSRRSIFHALSQRSAARKVSKKLGIDYEKSRFLVTHMGGGISIGAHNCGRVLDVINALDGEGPFSPERAGKIPALSALDLVCRGKYSAESLKKTMLTKGGMYAHLGTNDLREAEQRANEGDEYAARVIEAMAYQIAKETAALAPALMDTDSARIDAIILTGGMARSTHLVRLITMRLHCLAPVEVVEDVEEGRAMADGVFRVLSGKTEVLSYTQKPADDQA